MKNYINKIINGDCLEVMKNFDDESIDMILCDLPYGTTQYEWDKTVDLVKLWGEYERVIKDNGAILLTASQPFTTELINSNKKLFRYEIIWEKTQASGFLDSNKKPLKAHEKILVFYKKLPTYNPQKYYAGTNSIRTGKKSFRSGHYGRFLDKEEAGTSDGMRFPRSVIKFSNWNGALFGNTKNAVKHPTQKPVELLQYLIKTYTNEGDIVLDNCIGSGSTAIAAKNLNRNFIGIEILGKYCQVAEARLAEPRTENYLVSESLVSTET